MDHTHQRGKVQCTASNRQLRQLQSATHPYKGGTDVLEGDWYCGLHLIKEMDGVWREFGGDQRLEERTVRLQAN